MSDHQADYPIATMCRLLGVSPSGYYAWRKRQPSQRSEIDATLIAEIQVAHAASRGTYSAPRIHAELAARGIYIGRKRVARLMTQAGLAGVIGYLSPMDFEQRGQKTAADPDAHQPAAVLAAVKDKPSGRPQDAAVLDRRCARRPHHRAGRDGRMAPPGAEPKNASTQESNMPSNQSV